MDNEIVLRAELLKKDKETVVELYMQKCFDYKRLEEEMHLYSSYYKQLQYSLEDCLYRAWHNQYRKAIEQLETVRNYFIEEHKDEEGNPTGDSTAIKDIFEVADFIDKLIIDLEGEKNESK